MIARICLLAWSLGCVIGIGAAAAQDYPNRPIKLIVPFGAGGPTDILARIVVPSCPSASASRWSSSRARRRWQHRHPGGGQFAAGRLHPAGRGATNAINATLYTNMPFNFLNDIIPVSGMARVPNVMEVTPSLPVTTVAEFIAHAKANPGQDQLLPQPARHRRRIWPPNCSSR